MTVEEEIERIEEEIKDLREQIDKTWQAKEGLVLHS